MHSQRLPKVISVTSGKGGVGKTNVVANLAIGLANLGRNVLLLDADVGLGNLDVLLGLAPRYNIGHLLRGEKELADIIIDGPCGVKILPASSGIDELVRLSPTDKLKLFSHLEELYGEIEIMLIDTASGISENVLFFNTASHEIVVVASSEPTSIVDAYALIKVLHLKCGVKSFRILANSVVNAREGLEVYRNISMVAERYLHVSLDYIGFIPFDDNVPRAVKAQKALMELFPDSRANKKFSKVARLIDEIPYAETSDNLQFFWGGCAQTG
ncbi:MAG: MinD/ParA family protein [Thermodesulfobacteriota bacterium]